VQHPLGRRGLQPAPVVGECGQCSEQSPGCDESRRVDLGNPARRTFGTRAGSWSSRPRQRRHGQQHDRGYQQRNARAINCPFIASFPFSSRSRCNNQRTTTT
jgi:hypothetical protein